MRVIPMALPVPNSPGDPASPPAAAPRRVLGLVLGCLAIVLLWMVVLPLLGKQAALRRHIERNRAAGIHPDAMFYTEVGAIDGVQLVYEHGQPTGRSIRMGDK